MARQPWLRLYTAILDSPKLQLLPDRLFRLVINLWCLAKETDGILPHPTDCAFRLRLPCGKFDAMFEGVKHLFDEVDGRFRPHDWDEHQYAGDAVRDSSRDRTRRWRDKQRDGDVTLGDGVTVTACDGSDGSSPSRARAAAPSESALSSASVQDSDAGARVKAQWNGMLRTAITDPQWAEFRLRATLNGVDGSAADWVEAEFAWRPLDGLQRQRAIVNLPLDLIGKANCLPQNYLKKGIYDRQERAKPAGKTSYLDDVIAGRA